MAALNAEIPDELKTAFAKECLDRRVSLKDAVADALRLWMEPPSGGAEATVPPHLRPYLRNCSKILAHGNERAIEAIKTLSVALLPGASRKEL